MSCPQPRLSFSFPHPELPTNVKPPLTCFRPAPGQAPPPPSWYPKDCWLPWNVVNSGLVPLKGTYLPMSDVWLGVNDQDDDPEDAGDGMKWGKNPGGLFVAPPYKCPQGWMNNCRAHPPEEVNPPYWIETKKKLRQGEHCRFTHPPFTHICQKPKDESRGVYMPKMAHEYAAEGGADDVRGCDLSEDCNCYYQQKKKCCWGKWREDIEQGEVDWRIKRLEQRKKNIEAGLDITPL